jgi:excisionase family DNA binding protein
MVYVDLGGLIRDHNRKHEGEFEMQAPALTLKDFCDAYRVCRETAYQQIRAGRLRAVKLGRKTLILRADAEVWAAALPELRTAGRDQASA